MLGHYYTHTLVLLWCVRFFLFLSLLKALCVVVLCWWVCAPAAALSAAHYFVGPMPHFTYHLPSFTMQLMPYLLPLLASSFTFLFQASICARLLSSTLSPSPLLHSKRHAQIYIFFTFPSFFDQKLFFDIRLNLT